MTLALFLAVTVAASAPAAPSPSPVPVPALSAQERSLVGTWVSQARWHGSRLIVVLREDRTAETYAVVGNRRDTPRTFCYWELLPSDSAAVSDLLLIETASEHLVRIVDAQWQPDRCLQVADGTLQMKDGLTFRPAPPHRQRGSHAAAPDGRAGD